MVGRNWWRREDQTGSQDRELSVRVEASKGPLLSPPALGFLVETGALSKP